MSTTSENLQSAFAGESQASRKYLYFAEQADKEGQSQIARLFRAASEAETVHARNHLRVMSGIGTTTENLKSAISGEYHEMTEMYPEFIAQAKSEKNNMAEMTFNSANKVEKLHHGLYHQALKDLEAAKKLPSKPYYVCQVCGCTVESDAPDKCPVCGAGKTAFKKID
jgi:rubrerythrin